MKIWVAAVLAGATILAGTPSASADEAKTRAQLQKAYEAARKDDCPTALKLLRPTLKAKAIAELPGELAALGYHLAAVCEMRGGRIAEARAATVAGTAIDAASDDLWRLRFGLELDMEDHAAATATVVAMSQGRGAALNGIELRWLYQLSRKLREAKQDALQLQLLTQRHAPSPAQTWGQDLAQVLAGAHDAARARRVQNVLKVLLRGA